MTARAHIGLQTKLASALLALGHVPYEHAKQMTAAQLISLYQWDHGILHAVEVVNDYWNITPRLIAAHRQKSRADTGTVAKVKRLSERHIETRRRLLAPDKAKAEQPQSKWPKRKMQSRNDFQRRP